MLSENTLPPLSFPTLNYGAQETPLTLTPMLYIGGAGENKRFVGKRIANGQLGPIQKDRLPLIEKFHEVLSGKLAGGGSERTLRTEVDCLRHFYSWADEAVSLVTSGTVESIYYQWCDSLIQRIRVRRDLSPRAAYLYAAIVGKLIDVALGRPTAIIKRTRITMPGRQPTALSPNAEKLSLHDSMRFGQLLQDICDGLPSDIVLHGRLPVRIALRDGRFIEDWSHFPKTVAAANRDPADLNSAQARFAAKRSAQKFAHWEGDGTLRTRYPLANLRIEAELLMFIAQTGMNFAQAFQLRLRNFSYSSYLDGYQVKERKGRRGGDVLFEIFSEYRPHFERYLDWRRGIFPEVDLIFPLVRIRGRAENRPPDFRLRRICQDLGISFVSPRSLRSARVNWLLRQTTNPELTADLAQHSKQTLLNVYARPSQQRAMGEIMRFWSANDPGLFEHPSVAPGLCNGRALPSPEIPSAASTPDCSRPSGCLWCEHHRDIDSFDYIWALASFRRLKTIELALWHPPRNSDLNHPAKIAIEKITETLVAFQHSSPKRQEWYTEAAIRVEEGSFHPQWDALIHGAEALL